MADNEQAVKNFQTYLQINTEQPTPDYVKCKEFLFDYGKQLGFDVWAHEVY